ncbi:peptidase dimerization domain-containing protein [Flavonifractor plautii]|nr:peptidase dimerization domain-containing protein [Flavonifractor plautii]
MLGGYLSAGAARPYCDRAAAETGVRYELREEGDSLHILCRGKGAHASLPEEGVNAITGLLHLLCSLPWPRWAPPPPSAP